MPSDESRVLWISGFKQRKLYNLKIYTSVCRDRGVSVGSVCFFQEAQGIAQVHAVSVVELGEGVAMVGFSDGCLNQQQVMAMYISTVEKAG